MKLKGKLKDFLFSSHGVIFNLDLEPCLNKCSLDGSIFWLEAKSGHQFWNQNILAQSCWRTIIFISVSIQNPPEKVSGKKTPLSGTDWTLSPTWLFFCLEKEIEFEGYPLNSNIGGQGYLITTWDPISISDLCSLKLKWRTWRNTFSEFTD